ncbi:hypothetical protein [Paenibacillus pseudetheri]|uniref:Uncharacterized protein n=1 Tax=Paenibacillus pseudetheri TaxID=2897682 RepID=A0ABM9B8M1_9BACL|nr:hypothetical protein [Paenibacillus pseudetheri]CAH1054970.1 hypothetical protein PAECIP111894_01120 [Paenibacillus pseudetheri]
MPIKLSAEEQFKMAGDEPVRYVFAHEVAYAYQHQKWDINKLGYSKYVSSSDPAGDKRGLAFYKKELKTRNSASGWAPINWSNVK